MQLFYHPDINATTSNFSFGKEESAHIIKVLRKTKNQPLYITDGKGWLFTARITDANAKKCGIAIVEAKKQPSRPYHLHMAVAPTKNNQRYEWFLEKATEIGVDQITPIICKHSERKSIKPLRFKKVIAAAMKQSLQYNLPTLHEAISLHDFLHQSSGEQRFIAHCATTGKSLLKKEGATQQTITILIGPEGDFDAEEIRLATVKGYIPVSLGHTRLRTETAAIVACHSIALQHE